VQVQTAGNTYRIFSEYSNLLWNRFSVHDRDYKEIGLYLLRQ